MLKMRLNGTDDGSVIALGLSHANLDRLKAGQPIHFDLGPFGLPGFTFLIFAGTTENAMLDDLAANGLVDVKTAETMKRAMREEKK